MADEPVWWITVGSAAPGHPSAEMLEQVRDAIDGIFDDEADVLVTASDIEPIDAEDAERIVQSLIDALE